MSQRKQPVSKKNKSAPKRTRPLQLEPLEARMMNAIDAIEVGLEAFTSSKLREETPTDVPAQYGVFLADSLGNGNSAPRILQPVSFLRGSVIQGNTAYASVFGADNGGEQRLTYRWSVVRAPAGANVSFSVNQSNAAKFTTIRFDRAGEYDIMASAVDSGGLTASSTSRLTVRQELTSLRVESQDGQIVNPAMGVSTSQVDPAFRVQGIDQFGHAMAQTPPVVWTLRSGPATANVSQSVQGPFTRFAFSHPATYSLQANVGNRVVSFAVQNAPSSARVDLIQASGSSIPNGATIDVSSDRALVSVRAFNAQGVAIATPANMVWSLVSGPSGGTMRTTAQGSLATIVFNKVGTYSLSLQVNGVTRRFQVRVNPVVSSLAVSPNTLSLQAGQTQQMVVSRLDQFGQTMSSTSPIQWVATQGTISSTGLFTAGQTPGIGFVTAAIGSIRSTVRISVVAAPSVLTMMQLRDTAGTALNDGATITTGGKQVRVEVRITDPAGRVITPNPSTTMTVQSAPSGGQATLAMNGSIAILDFTRTGNYEVSLTSGSMSRKLRIAVSATLTSLQITPNAISLQAGQSRQFTAVGIDQFGQTMASIPPTTWSSTGGSISAAGMYSAGSTAGSGSVKAQIGSVSATATITIIASSSPFQNAAIAQLVQTYYVDQQIDRTEMMAILRSVGSDSIVDTAELSDLRTLVNSTQYVMPAHVRGLARNTVFDNPANLRFQGQVAGNLTANASSSLLNKLIDKWFLGVDLPALAGHARGYAHAMGSLFQVNPTLENAKQGMIGDCYFIAALGSIASRNPQAIREMFDDNGDGTFTVRFFGRNSSGASTADYVTVDRRLPTYSGSILAYAGIGLSASQASSVLWIGLAEKAYAQWNETGRAGRDGTNSYRGIEGGWMSNVNFQVLGYHSSNHSFATSSQQTLINALDQGFAVTTGTKTSVPSGLVASHAYSITGFQRATGKFTLHNPWGFMHPSPLTWAELQANFSMFTTTDPRGSGGEVASSGFRSESLAMASPSIGNSIAIAHAVNASELPSITGLAGLDRVAANHSPLGSIITVDSLETWDPIAFAASIQDSMEQAGEDLTETSDLVGERISRDLALADLYLRQSLA
jgi:hypothetical protein